jgi:hypothetical protein
MQNYYTNLGLIRITEYTVLINNYAYDICSGNNTSYSYKTPHVREVHNSIISDGLHEETYNLIIVFNYETNSYEATLNYID